MQDELKQIKVKAFNSLNGKEELIKTINPKKLSMYVCGPTVYDRPHIGNARSVVIYDLFYRLFKKLYPEVIYVRNITDVDDKINQAAKERKISIKELTDEITKYFYHDIDALNVLRPTIEPRATKHIAEMITMIAKLLENGSAYESEGHVLFSVKSYKNYGQLSNRHLDDMIAGSRIEIADYKRDPLDFVLWKPANKDDDVSSIFDSPFGRGRPGWHIECSAMSCKYLGVDFDIHGGGADLQFPHHENEIAQSCAANSGSNFAKYWIHNGFLTVEGEKMSKSLKNFLTVFDLLKQNIAGIVIRYLLLSIHYRKPLDYTQKSLQEAIKAIDKFYLVLDEEVVSEYQKKSELKKEAILEVKFIQALSEDLNISKVIALLHELVKEIKHLNEKKIQSELQLKLIAALDFIGLFSIDYFNQKKSSSLSLSIDESYILNQIKQRKQAKANKNWLQADQIRSDLLNQGIILEDSANNQTIWKISK
jgi:cysteinyl-tRNA synthetase